MPALLFITALFVISAGLVLGGVYLLLGTPSTLIAAGLAVFCAALALRSGLMPNG